MANPNPSPEWDEAERILFGFLDSEEALNLVSL